MKESIIVIITLAGLFCGIKLESRYYPESNAPAPSGAKAEAPASDDKNPQ